MSAPQAPREITEEVKLPPPLGIIAVILLIAAIAAQVLPRGEFQRQEKTIWDRREYVVQAGDTPESILKALGAKDGPPVEEILDKKSGTPATTLTAGQVLYVPVEKRSTRKLVVPKSYKVIEDEAPRPFLERAKAAVGVLCLAPMKGFQDKADIIAFILIIGGAFGVILSTGAIDAFLRWAVDFLTRLRIEWILIPGLMTLFSLGGAMFGMSEEVIPFAMICVPLAIRLGYDSLTGLCMCFVAAGIGFAGAFFNPFTVGIAQAIAGLPAFSGFGFRVGMWVAATLVGIVWTMRWAARVKRNPELSPVYENDRRLIHKFERAEGAAQRLGTREIGVLLIIGGIVIGSAVGVTKFGWYIDELAALFLAGGVLSALISGMGMTTTAERFVRGASDLVGAALIVAFSAGIVGILQGGQVLDTLLHWIAGMLDGTHSLVAAWLMFLFQAVFNLLVSSGSGQAAMTIPITAPLSDLLGVSRQICVLAFQFGNGFADMILPTSAVTMSVLGIAEIPWSKWARYIWPLVAILHLFGAIAIAVAFGIGLE